MKNRIVREGESESEQVGSRACVCEQEQVKRKTEQREALTARELFFGALCDPRCLWERALLLLTRLKAIGTGRCKKRKKERKQANTNAKNEQHGMENAQEVNIMRKGEKAQSWHDRTSIQRTRDGVEKGSWQNGEKNVLEVKEKLPQLPRYSSETMS